MRSKKHFALFIVSVVSILLPHWISVPEQIGDPILGATWRVVLKHYRPISPLLILWQRKTFGRGWLENGTSLSKNHLGRINLWDVHQGMETA